MPELLIFAAIAAFVLYQFYNVLGRRVGLKSTDEKNNPGRSDPETSQSARAERLLESLRLPNLEALKSRDTNFNEVVFVEKARESYEQVVKAFHAGNLDAVADRLSPQVHSAFKDAIAARGAEVTETMSFVEPPRADIDTIDFNDDLASVRVRFLAELTYESSAPEPQDADTAAAKPVKSHRRTAEYWTFQKSVKSSSAAWILARVEAARP